MTKVSDCSFDFENKVLGVIPRYDPLLKLFAQIYSFYFRLVINEKKEYDASGTKEFDRFVGVDLFKIWTKFFYWLLWFKLKL